jgi:hypothetical protein
MSKKTPPQGFRLYREKDKHNIWRYFYVCTKKVFDPVLQEQRECGYRIRTDNRLSKKHSCGQHSLLQYTSNTDPAQDDPSNQKFDQNVTNSLHRFVGEQNISIRSITSDSFKKFLKEICIFSSKHSETNILDNIPISSPTQYRRSFITHSNVLQKHCFSEFMDVSSLVIDAGTIFKFNFLHMILCNPLKKLTPLAFQNVRNFGGTSIDYRNALIKCLLTLKSLHIDIAGVTTDNLKAQKVIFSQFGGPEPIIPANDELSGLIRAPCQCHCMSLVLNDMISTGQFADHYVIIETAVAFMRSKNVRQRIGFTCPSICKTRWRVVFSILNWFRLHFSKILEFIIQLSKTKKATLTPEIEAIINVLFVILPSDYAFFCFYDLLIGNLEADICLFAEVILLYRAFNNFLLNEIPQFSHSNSKIIIDDFEHFFHQRLHSTCDINLLYVVSCFIPAGRQNIRSMMDFIRNEPDDILDNLTHADSDFFPIQASLLDMLAEFKTNIVINSDHNRNMIISKFCNCTEFLDQSQSSPSASGDCSTTPQNTTSSSSDDEIVDEQASLRKDPYQNSNTVSDENNDSHQSDEDTNTDTSFESDNEMMPVFKLMNKIDEDERTLINSVQTLDEKEIMEKIHNPKNNLSILNEYEDETEETEAYDTVDGGSQYDIHEGVDVQVQQQSDMQLDKILEWGQRFVSQYAYHIGITRSISPNLGDAFMRFVTTSTAELEILYNGQNSLKSFWTYMSTKPEFKELAIVAKYLLSLMASEAPAERCFSVHRKVLSPDKYSTRPDLETAKIFWLFSKAKRDKSAT